MQEYIDLTLKIIEGVLMVIGGSTIIFRILHPLTETKIDDKIYRVLVNILTLSKKLSLNKDTGLNIKLKKK